MIAAAAQPWSRPPQGVDHVVEGWLAEGSVRECLALERLLPEAGARWSELPPALDAGLARALRARGIERLYTHQAEAVGAALASRHVVVATPTASGKSLCFHLPVLDALARDPTASALFVYPTKALARDQEHALHALARESGHEIPALVVDGDTPGDARRAARERGRIVLTNPDMLHAGILPNHARWASFFQGLRYVVLDELHVYRGVFGSHLAHVLARLRRVAAFHAGAEPPGAPPRPVFLSATATIGNPLEHAARLLGVPEREVSLVAESGAPRAARRLLVYNPPVVNAELGLRASTLKRAVALTADLVRARVPTLLFAQSRNSVEVMLKYLRAEVGAVAGPGALQGYRGGYLPETRRAIERGLREGEILCVVATNALELGIDIGDLDAVVLAGYPGSVAGAWQRFGRAGRRGTSSIALLVCSSEPTDQYVASDPEWLVRESAEEARIDPSNAEILLQHLKCACFEAPIVLEAAPPRVTAAAPPPRGEAWLGLDAASTRDALQYLAGHGLVHERGDRWYWSGEAFPASHVSLRNIGWDNFVIVDEGSGTALAELDWRAAHTMLHEQAIYQHDAATFQVERLDYENHKAYVRRVEPDYFTTALTYRTVEVIEPQGERALAAPGGRAAPRVGLGDVKVEEKVTGYKKIRFFTHENAGYGDVHLPEMQMHTVSFWLTLPEALVAEVGVPRAAVVEGLRGLGWVLEAVASVALMCDPRDLGRTLGDGSSDDPGAPPPGRDWFAGRTGRESPTLFLFDQHPGGVGLAPRIYERAEELLARAATIITGCGCAHGCPACVGPGAAGSLHKAGARALVAALGLGGGARAAPVAATAARL
ncbi:MAG: DEAD/DEAH box helicase [Polyangiaceae bacterium]|nr:DEAD/DEAH box helicase [Polyangiaceae bacterium]